MWAAGLTSLVLPYLACAGQSGRDQTSESFLKADDQLQTFATLLRTLAPADAFNPSIAGAPTRSASASAGLGHSISHSLRSSGYSKMGMYQDVEDKVTAIVTGEASEKTPPKKSKCISQEVFKLKSIGGSSYEKALAVNLDTSIYGSFAEIGAGQEVSRTFLQAGAAAGTVAKSLSAYDMQMSDALYGTAKRYVTQERLIQMMSGEYKDLEQYVREGKAAWGGKGPEVRFFSFAATLAAKAFNSDRECEGWVGIQYQHEPGAEISTVTLHIRMSDPTATLQGEAIGILGTNLVYLITNTNNPYVIASFLQDGIDVGRLEIDYLNFEGPGFPMNSFDPRVLALQMVQSRVSPCVLLELDSKSGKYSQAIPNDALYKTPVFVQRSRFAPVTITHQELMDAANRQLAAGSAAGDRSPKGIFDLQIDDLMMPAQSMNTIRRFKRIWSLLSADSDWDGWLSVDQLKRVLDGKKKGGNPLSDELVSALDPDDSGFVEIDALAGFAADSPAVMAFLDRVDMLQTLKYPILVSGIERGHMLAEYLTRYTTKEVTLLIGGGGYSFSKGLYNPKSYDDLDGGLLEAFGRLFAKNVKILQYPNIRSDGTVSPIANPAGEVGLLHYYLLQTGNIGAILQEHMSKNALDSTINQAFCIREVSGLIESGDPSWETCVPPAVATIVKNRKGYSNTTERARSIVRYFDSIPN